MFKCVEICVKILQLSKMDSGWLFPHLQQAQEIKNAKL